MKRLFSSESLSLLDNSNRPSESFLPLDASTRHTDHRQIPSSTESTDNLYQAEILCAPSPPSKTKHESFDAEAIEQFIKYNNEQQTQKQNSHQLHLSTKSQSLLTDEALNEARKMRISLNYNNNTRYTFYSTKRARMIQANSFNELKDYSDTTENKQPASILQLIKEGVFWLDINNPSEHDMEFISKIFNIHPLTVEDIRELDLETREKFEIYENYLFLSIKTPLHKQSSHSLPTSYYQSIHSGYNRPEKKSFVIETVNLFIVVCAGFTLTFHHDHLQCATNVIRRMMILKHTVTLEITAEWIMYALLDAITDDYLPSVSLMEDECDSVEDLITFSLPNLHNYDQQDILRQIGAIKKQTTKLSRLLQPKIEIIKGLIKKSPDRLSSYTVLYLRDIQDHILQMLQKLEGCLDTIERSLNNYLAQLSIGLSQASNKLNIVMKKITASAFLIVPLNLIASIWGMNVTVPGSKDYADDNNSSLRPFFTIISVMISVVFLMLIIGKKYDWF